MSKRSPSLKFLQEENRGWFGTAGSVICTAVSRVHTRRSIFKNPTQPNAVMPRLSTEKKTARSDLFRSVGLRVATAAVCYFQSRRNQPTTIDSWKNSRSAEKVWVFAAFRKGKKKKKSSWRMRIDANSSNGSWRATHIVRRRLAAVP